MHRTSIFEVAGNAAPRIYVLARRASEWEGEGIWAEGFMFPDIPSAGEYLLLPLKSIIHIHN